jgi:hypothetical protein
VAVVVEDPLTRDALRTSMKAGNWALLLCVVRLFVSA